MQCFQMMMFA